MYGKERKIQAYTEIGCLLKCFPIEYTKKIPDKLLEMIYNNYDSRFFINVDTTKKISNQKISNLARNMLAVLTFNYWSNEEQKEKIKAQLIKNEQK